MVKDGLNSAISKLPAGSPDRLAMEKVKDALACARHTLKDKYDGLLKSREKLMFVIETA